LIRAGPWHDARRLSQHGKAVDPALGAAEGVLMSMGELSRSRACSRWREAAVRWRLASGPLPGRGCIGLSVPRADTLLERRWYVPAAGRTDDRLRHGASRAAGPSRPRATPSPRGPRPMIAAVGQSQALRGPWAAWTRQTINAGRQGPRVAECAALRVVAVRDTCPVPTSGWGGVDTALQAS